MYKLISELRNFKFFLSDDLPLDVLVFNDYNLHKDVAIVKIVLEAKLEEFIEPGIDTIKVFLGLLLGKVILKANKTLAVHRHCLLCYLFEILTFHYLYCHALLHVLLSVFQL
jgi:hypothetical protein